MIFASLPLLVLAARGVMADAASAADEKNIDVSYWIGWCWVSLVGSLLVYQIVIHLISYIRQVSCLNNDTQRYFFRPDSWYAATKKYLISAPLFRTRHHREFKLSAALNVGTLPSRLQTTFLVSYIGANAALTVIAIDFTGKEKTIGPILRNRSGTLAVLNMLPLFLLAGRNNPLIKLCGITFDTFNLIHRWIGRIVVFEAVVHTLSWLVPKVHQSGWAVVAKSFQSSEMIISGIIATSAFLFILIASPSIVRHAFYEVFLHLHILCAALAIGALWYHLSELWHIKLLYGVIALWCAERFTRFATLIYRNIGGKKNSKATIEILPGEALRVTLAMARPWDFRPGQHIYLYLPSVGWWMSHPFSLAWSQEAADLSDEKGLVMNRQDILEMNNSKTEMSLIVRCRTGFTKKLYNKADKSAKGVITTSCLVEGPYGGESLTSYGTVMLFAAGVGITHQVPHVRDLVASYANGTAATRRVTLVWIIQSPEHLEWIRPWMTTILAMPKRRDILKIQLFVTRPRSTREIHSPSASVQMFPGKPNVQSLIDNEMQDAVGAGCVSVCGTGSLADDVRRAVRRNMGVWNVDFREESFSW